MKKFIESSPNWISPEAAKKLSYRLRKNFRRAGSWAWQYFVKVNGVYYLDGEPFHEDGAVHFEGKITEVKINPRKRATCSWCGYEFWVKESCVEVQCPSCSRERESVA